MTFILALLAGIAGAVICYLGATAAGFVLAGASGMSDFEGGRAMFAAFVVGPLGGLIGLAVGIWLVLRTRGRYRGGGIVWRGALVVVAIGALVAGGIGYMVATNEILNPNALPLQLDFEIRLPAGSAMPTRVDRVSVDLQTDRNTMPAVLDADATRMDGDRAVLAGLVELYFRTTQRMIVLHMANEPDRIFQLALSARPRLSEEYGSWTRVDFIAQASSDPPRKAEPGDDFEIRYRVPDRDKPPPQIEFEIRLPEGTALPDDFHDVYTAQRRDKAEDQGFFLHYDWRRLDDNRPVLLGGMAINAPKQHPKIVLRLPGGAGRVFNLNFPAVATPTPEFSAWKLADAVEETPQPPRSPARDDGYEMRYRIIEPR